MLPKTSKLRQVCLSKSYTLYCITAYSFHPGIAAQAGKAVLESDGRDHPPACRIAFLAGFSKDLERCSRIVQDNAHSRSQVNRAFTEQQLQLQASSQQRRNRRQRSLTRYVFQSRFGSSLYPAWDRHRWDYGMERGHLHVQAVSDLLSASSSRISRAYAYYL